MQDWTIKDIEELTPAILEIWQDTEKTSVKGYDVYWTHLGRFGLSAIVCADGQQLKYANKYQLHFAESLYPTEASVRERMVELLEASLFTEEELASPCGYQEAEARKRFLQSVYSYRREHQSIFGDAAEWYEREKAEGRELPFSPVALGYYHDYDKWFVEHLTELYVAVERANDPLGSYESAFEAFKHEMYNHEYPINWQGDWDVINCFKKVEYKGDGTEIDETGWPEDIKRAYYDAARYVQMNGEW